jgi:hypothetical protein
MNHHFWKDKGNTVLVYSNPSDWYATLEAQPMELDYVE